MKIQLIANEYFSWGQHGGYGAFTKKLAEELVKKGIVVEVKVQKIMPTQKPIGKSEIINGVRIVTLPRTKMGKWWTGLYDTDADLIHSECGMLDTYMSFTVNTPDVFKWEDTPKILSLQDLRTKEETAFIGEAEPKGLANRIWARYVYWLYGNAMRQADVVAPQANVLVSKIKPIFGFSPNKLKRLQILPNFVDPPTIKIEKDNKPNILFLGRLDKIKNPELCFETANSFPEADFYVLGNAHDPTRDRYLRIKYGKIKNLHLLGFNDTTTKATCLSKAWILINTSIYESLPVSFLEAMAYNCALLSAQNPDEYTEKFGCHVGKLEAPYFIQGLKNLLKNDFWQKQAEKGNQHYKEHHTTEKGVAAHINLYKELIQK